MAIAEGPTADVGNRQWYIVGRWQEYEGEERANLIRVIAIGAFYIVELFSYYGVSLGVIQFPRIHDAVYHRAITALAVAGVMVALAIQLSLRRQFFPASLKFISTGCDLLLLTCTILIGIGPRSPLVAGYFLVIALAALRFNLPLVRFTTAGAMAGYLVVLGYVKWFAALGVQETLSVPRYHQMIVLLTLGLIGITLGQIIRRVRSLAEEYMARLSRASGSETPTS
jgi:hypothetical protein